MSRKQMNPLLFAVTFFLLLAQVLGECANSFNAAGVFAAMASSHGLHKLAALNKKTPCLFDHLQYSDGEQITFLAPSDDAFRKLLESPYAKDILGDDGNADKFKGNALYANLFAYQTIHGRHNSTQLFDTEHILPTYFERAWGHSNGTPQVIKTAMRNDVGFVHSGVNESTFLRGKDIALSNGIMHIVDSFLRLPVSVTATVDEMGLVPFKNALQSSHLDSLLNLHPLTTIFVPQKMLYEDLPERRELIDIVAFHVLENGTMFATDLKAVARQKNSPVSSMLMTVHGGLLEVTTDEGEMFVNGVKIVGPDIITTTGVIHVIEHALQPKPANSYKKGDPCICKHRFCGSICNNENDKNGEKGENGGNVKNAAIGGGEEALRNSLFTAAMAVLCWLLWSPM